MDLITTCCWRHSGCSASPPRCLGLFVFFLSTLLLRRCSSSSSSSRSHFGGGRVSAAFLLPPRSLAIHTSSSRTHAGLLVAVLTSAPNRVVTRATIVRQKLEDDASIEPDDNDDDDVVVPSSLFSFPQPKQQQQRQHNDLEQLLALVAKQGQHDPTSSITTPGNKTSSTSQVDRMSTMWLESESGNGNFNDDAVYMDPDMYVAASDRIDVEDGSLPLLTEPYRPTGKTATAAAAATTTMISPGEDDSESYRQLLQQLMESQPSGSPIDSTTMDDVEHMDQENKKTQYYSRRGSQQQLVPDPDDDVQQQQLLWDAMRINRHKWEQTSTELHERVFQEEVGYQQQSQLFKEGLLDQAKAAQHKAYRQGEAFRSRQEQAVQSLEQQILEWEQELQAATAAATAAEEARKKLVSTDNKSPQEEPRCLQCKCAMSPAEVAKGDGICQLCHADALIAMSTRSSSSSNGSNNNNNWRGPLQSQQQQQIRPESQWRSATTQRAPQQAQARSWLPQRPWSPATPPTSRISVNKTRTAPSQTGLVTPRPIAVMMNKTSGTPVPRGVGVENQPWTAVSPIASSSSSSTSGNGTSTSRPWSGEPLPDHDNNNNNTTAQHNPWVEVTDPDTGDVFFWNEVTQEMKW